MTVFTSVLPFVAGQNAAVVTPLTVEVNASPRSGNAPLAVALTATSLGGRAGATKTYSWNYGDGTTGTGASVAKTYTTPGTYTATVTVSDTVTTASASVAVVVGSPAQPLAATFAASPSSGAAPLSVTFTTTPSGGAGSYTVTVAFGDGTSGGGRSTSKSYSTPGTYTATATISDGVSSITRTATVTVSQPVVTPLLAVLTPSTASGTAPYSVAFSASAAGGTPPYTYAYTFGDGGSSTSQNPTYSFQTAGTYTVTLTVRDGTRVATATASVEVGGTSTGPTNFDTWKDKTIPPNSDWSKYGSYEGNPNFNPAKLSATLKTYYDKAWVYNKRLTLLEDQTYRIPGTTTDVRYIKSNMSYSFGPGGGEDRDWHTALRQGRKGNVQDIRLFSRFAFHYCDQALNAFYLLHDLDFLDFACFWLEAYWDALITYNDATAVWTGSGATRKVTTTTNVNGKAWAKREWLKRYPNDYEKTELRGKPDYRKTTDDGLAKYWSSIYYQKDGAPMESLRHNDHDMSGARKTKKMVMCDQTAAVTNDGNGAAWGTVQPLEDGILFGVWARLLRALYANLGKTSPAGKNYVDLHEKMRHIIIDNFFPSWFGNENQTTYSKYGGHPIIMKTLTHAHTQITRFYWHLYLYAKARADASSGTTKTEWTTQASNYLKSFAFLGEPLASDVMFVDLKDQTTVDTDLKTTDVDYFNEDQPMAIWPHRVGAGGYDRSWSSESATWSTTQGLGGKTTSRQDSGHPKVIYVTQTYDAAFDMYLSRYWEDLPSEHHSAFKMRRSKSDSTKDAYLWGDKYHTGCAVNMVYSVSIDPSDETTGKDFWQQWGGSVKDGTTGSWYWRHRMSLQTLGGGSGADGGVYTLSYMLRGVLVLTLMWADKLTGKYKDVLPTVVEKERVRQGGWDVGETDTPLESYIQFYQWTMASKS